MNSKRIDCGESAAVTGGQYAFVTSNDFSTALKESLAALAAGKPDQGKQ